MQVTQPSPGPYKADEVALKRELYVVTHDHGQALHNTVQIFDSRGRYIAEVKFSTCNFTAEIDGETRPIHCNDHAEFIANCHQFAASWLMREALKKHKEFEEAESRFFEGDGGPAGAYSCDELQKQWLALRDAALLAAEGTVQP